MLNRLISPEDLYNFKFVYDPQISPTSNVILFTVSQARLDDSYDGTIWKYNDGKINPIISLGEQSSNPVWTTDGSRFLFLVRDGTSVEIWVSNSSGNTKHPIISISNNRIFQPRWSPDNQTVFFLSEEKTPRQLSDVKIIRRLHYRSDGEGYTYNRRRHIFSAPASNENMNSERLKQHTNGPFDVVDFDISPDGKKIVFAANLREYDDVSFDMGLHELSLDNKTGTHQELYSGKGQVNALSISPDGNYAAFIGHDFSHKLSTLETIWIYDIQNHSVSRVADKFDRATINSLAYDAVMGNTSARLVWNAASSKLYFLSTDHGSSNIFSAKIGDGSTRKVTEGDHAVNSFSLSRDGTIAFTMMDSLHLSELFILDNKSGSKEKQVTDFNTPLLEEVRLSEPQRFSFFARDGKEIEGWYWPPAVESSNTPPPCIVEIHGGRSSEGNTFMQEFHTLCSLGFALITCNFRGTSGYGEDFFNLTGHYLETDFTDIIDMVDYAVERKWADPKRLGVFGGSYGGLLTNWIITHDQRFAAAVADRSIVDQFTFYGTSDDYRRIEQEVLKSLPWDNFDLYYSKSPIKYIQNVTTPLLLIHSEEDYRVPISQAEMAFAFLKRLGKEVVLARFPGESHSLSRSGRPRHRVERMQLYMWWFSTHIDGTTRYENPLEEQPGQKLR